MRVMVINGPNLSRLDLREKNFYGDISYGDIEETVNKAAQALGFSTDIRQSNDEAEIPIVFNPAAFTHYSYAIRDAVSMLKAPSIEVHISNPLSREEFRHTSVIAGVVNGTIAGFGLDSYRLALEALSKLVK
jgi:3-dehydroquinate dehydratase-2